MGELAGRLEFWDAGEIEQMGAVMQNGLAAFIATKYVSGMGDNTMENFLFATGTSTPSTVIGSSFAQFGAKAWSTFFKKPASETDGE